MYTSTQIQRRRERERNTKKSKRLFAIDERMHNGRNEYMCDSILSPTFDPRQIRSTISTRTNRQTKQKKCTHSLSTAVHRPKLWRRRRSRKEKTRKKSETHLLVHLYSNNRHWTLLRTAADRNR